MEMTIDNITALTTADESRTLELKKTTGELKDGMHSACAFLNTDGGYVGEMESAEKRQSD